MAMPAIVPRRMPDRERKRSEKNILIRTNISLAIYAFSADWISLSLSFDAAECSLLQSDFKYFAMRKLEQILIKMQQSFQLLRALQKRYKTSLFNLFFSSFVDQNIFRYEIYDNECELGRDEISSNLSISCNLFSIIELSSSCFSFSRIS